MLYERPFESCTLIPVGEVFGEKDLVTLFLCY
jgi:hypothetical protein